MPSLDEIYIMFLPALPARVPKICGSLHHFSPEIFGIVVQQEFGKCAEDEYIIFAFAAAFLFKYAFRSHIFPVSGEGQRLFTSEEAADPHPEDTAYFLPFGEGILFEWRIT